MQSLHCRRFVSDHSALCETELDVCVRRARLGLTYKSARYCADYSDAPKGSYDTIVIGIESNYLYKYITRCERDWREEGVEQTHIQEAYHGGTSLGSNLK